MRRVLGIVQQGPIALGVGCALTLLACGNAPEADPTDGKTNAEPEPSAPPAPEPPPVDCEWDFSLPRNDSETLFDLDQVPTFELHLPDEKWEALIAHAIDEEWEEAEACFNGKYIGRIGMRFKGSYGTLYSCFENGELVCDRLSLKLKFSLLDDELRFFGLKRLNFNANRHDDSRLKERLAYDLYRTMDIPTPRASWAVVKVNGQSYGLYGMVEEVDGRFTADRFPDNPDGNLYKEIWPTDNEPEYVTGGLKTNEDTADISSFLEMSAAVNGSETPQARLEVLGDYTDLDLWARYLAVDEAILSLDGASYFYTDDGVWFHNHNYYLYEDSPSHFAIIPWDVESSFWINPDHVAPHWTFIPEDCSETYPYWSGLAVAPACDPVFRALGTDQSLFRDAMQELLDGPFSLEEMNANIDRHVAFIEEEALKPETPTAYVSFPLAVADLRRTLPLLRDRMESLLAEE